MNAAVRHPAVAGTFYPENPDALESSVKDCLAKGASASPARDKSGGRLFALMLPHAGYVYCGHVIGATLAGLALPCRFIVLCPNHTGQGHPFGVWPDGAWLTPLGPVKVDAALAASLVKGVYAPDTRCHLREHSIEVLLPFLQILTRNEARIVPVCVGTRDPQALRAAGLGLAAALAALYRDDPDDVCILVSSDMNHYENEQTTLKKDDLALERALSCDPEGLLAVVAERGITMCGASPLAVALFAAKALGEPSAGLVLHDTSAGASGDTSRTVGYAGLRFHL
ncbi:MAG: AmmeMemoRadiSam system protein B [Desulfovibrio sp.]|jgi:AmmeMemoRadiSam system protein B|nr:AmmeMemoRadiSam system protein B [Desulfovibrio sp.]